jgi:restriction system protein
MISQVVDPREVVRKVRQQDSSTLNADDTGQIVTGPDGNQTLDWPEDIAPKWRDTVIQILRELSPDAFERLCTRLLRESGFIEVEVTGKSDDGGIDGRGIIRVGGLISFNVLFQSKRYQENVGASVVRDFRGAMIGRADKGLIITTAGFTRDAKKEATRDGAPPIDLIDGYLLAEKLKELKLGITTELAEAVDVDKGWFTSI